MLNRVCLAAAILAVVATPAFAADECGNAPIAPAMPTANDLSGMTVEAARAEVLNAYHQIKTYQAALVPFRACLKAQSASNKAALAEAQGKGDKAKIDTIQQALDRLQKVYDGTVDTETQVVNEFNAAHVAHCARDTDPNICKR
jgi:hypothetical protein